MGQYYTKIQTIFKRDNNNVIIPGDYTLPEFDALKNLKWEATEKIDGTNMSVHIISYPSPVYDEVAGYRNYKVEYHGKTEKADTPAHLQKKMEELFPADKIIEYFKSTSKDGIITDTIQIFGEGYGVKIQNGGNYIKNDCGFILFDVKVGKYWLTREACEKIAQDLNIPIVPLIGYFTIPEAIAKVSAGFKSTIAENPNYDAEGFVLKAPCGILMRNGERLITKIKSKDFNDFIRRYPERKQELENLVVRSVTSI